MSCSIRAGTDCRLPLPEGRGIHPNAHSLAAPRRRLQPRLNAEGAGNAPDLPPPRCLAQRRAARLPGSSKDVVPGPKARGQAPAARAMQRGRPARRKPARCHAAQARGETLLGAGPRWAGASRHWPLPPISAGPAGRRLQSVSVTPPGPSPSLPNHG